jgi:hypothetical protein
MLVVTLTRTDTTLDLSHTAKEAGEEKRGRRAEGLYMWWVELVEKHVILLPAT